MELPYFLHKQKAWASTSARLPFEVLGKPLKMTRRVSAHAGIAQIRKSVREGMVSLLHTIRDIDVIPVTVTFSLSLIFNLKFPRFQMTNRQSVSDASLLCSVFFLQSTSLCAEIRNRQDKSTDYFSYIATRTHVFSENLLRKGGKRLQNMYNVETRWSFYPRRA